MYISLTEIKPLLLNRIGFRQDARFNLVLNPDNLQSDSGLVFQGEYTFITLENIYETMEMVNANTEEFNDYLTNLRNDTVIKVINDVFDKSLIEEKCISENLNSFDAAISKRMAIVLGEQIITTTRSSRTEKITKAFMQRLFFELNGNTSNNGSVSNNNFPTYIGLKSRYGQEINRLRDKFNTEKMLDVHTIGILNQEFYKDENYRDELP